MGPVLHVQLLGQFSVRRDHTPLTALNSPRIQELLAYLLLHRAAPQSRAQLAFRLWPESSEEQARTNLRSLFHQLRAALPENFYLQASRQTIQWLPSRAVELDVERFETLLAEAGMDRNPAPPKTHPPRPPSPPEETARQEIASQEAARLEASRLETAASLYAGDLLPDCYAEWVLPERERLRLAYERVLERLVFTYESQHAYAQAIAWAQKLLQHDPLHEAAYRRLMRLLALNGSRAEALRVYQVCVERLKTELDVAPSGATRQVYEHLLRDAPPHLHFLPSPSTPPGPAAPRCLGRSAEWSRLLAAWKETSAGNARLALVSGETGSGKTRLLEDWLHWAEGQGIRAALARCYPGEGGLSLRPVAAWLRARPLPHLETTWLAELAALLPEAMPPETGQSLPPAATPALQRARLFEALARAVLARPGAQVLLVDDLDGCDPDTAAWLHYLLRYRPAAPLLVVGAVQPSRLRHNPDLQDLLVDLRVAGVVRPIPLAPLDEAASASLYTQVSGQALSLQQAAALNGEAQGRPRFVIDLAKAGWPVTASASPPLPDALAARLEADLRLLSTSALTLLEACALCAATDREASAGMLAPVLGWKDESLACALDELVQAGLLQENGPESYRPASPLHAHLALAQAGPRQARSLKARLESARPPKAVTPPARPRSRRANRPGFPPWSVE